MKGREKAVQMEPTAFNIGSMEGAGGLSLTILHALGCGPCPDLASQVAVCVQGDLCPAPLLHTGRADTSDCTTTTHPVLLIKAEHASCLRHTTEMIGYYSDMPGKNLRL